MQQFHDEQECKKCKGLLFDYVTDLTDKTKSAYMREHLSHCDGCRAEYDEICQMLSVLHEIPEPELPKGFELSLHQKLVQAAAQVQEEKERSIFSRLKKLGGLGGWKVAAPALVCFVLALSAYSGGMFEVWKDADTMLVMGEPTQAPQADIPAVTDAPRAEETTAPLKQDETPVAVPRSKEANTAAVQTEVTPAPVKDEAASNSPAQDMAEAGDLVQDAAADSAAQPEAAAHSLTREETASNSMEQAEDPDAQAKAQVPMMMSYRMTNQEASVNYTLTVTGTPEAYLAACDAATSMALAESAAFTEQTAILHLSVTEWETFSQYIATTDAVLTLAEEPTEEGTVVVEIYGYEG